MTFPACRPAAIRHLAIPLRWFLLGLIQTYRYLGSPLKVALLGPDARCRFVPSCSAYALGAVQNHGPFVGTQLAARRICRCHPWGGHGPDPVPGTPVLANR